MTNPIDALLRESVFCSTDLESFEEDCTAVIYEDDLDLMSVVEGFLVEGVVDTFEDIMVSAEEILTEMYGEDDEILASSDADDDDVDESGNLDASGLALGAGDASSDDEDALEESFLDDDFLDLQESDDEGDATNADDIDTSIFDFDE